MNVEENIAFARARMADNIWKASLLEGLEISYEQVRKILEEGTAENLSEDDLLTVTNLKDAWAWLLRDLGQPFALETLCELQRRVSRDQALIAGDLRTGPIGISGTEYRPPIPEKETVREELSHLMQKPDPTDRALRVMLYGMRAQLCYDGNKRTSMLAANKILMENGLGLIAVPPEDLETFHRILSDYYTTGDGGEMIEYLKEKCLEK